MKGVEVKSVTLPEISIREVMRYLGCRDSNERINEEIDSCICEARGAFASRVVFTELDVRIDGKICDFGSFSIHSSALAKNLLGCYKVIVFAATAGMKTDRLIAKYSRLSPSRSVIFQAIGTERVEALCDAFCDEYEKEQGVSLKPRFSPGYADLKIEHQRDIFKLLDCPKNIGVSLNDSLLMSPSKSVTAFVGIKCKEKI